jgi:hypothetical protein
MRPAGARYSLRARPLHRLSSGRRFSGPSIWTDLRLASGCRREWQPLLRETSMQERTRSHAIDRALLPSPSWAHQG